MVNRISDSNLFFPENSSSVMSDSILVEFQSANSENFQTASQQNKFEQQPLPVDKVKKMTDSINQFLETTNTSLRFQFHEELQEYYVTIVDTKTNELVKEVPSKKLMDIYASMRDFLGLLVDHKI